MIYIVFNLLNFRAVATVQFPVLGFVGLFFAQRQRSRAAGCGH
jgi:hypothetical protein